jgi:hypothetical protein
VRVTPFVKKACKKKLERKGFSVVNRLLPANQTANTGGLYVLVRAAGTAVCRFEEIYWLDLRKYKSVIWTGQTLSWRVPAPLHCLVGAELR